ncbi:MAG: DNA alkylation response protein [Burkholderiaceae bacterium]|jgi:putative acyl-CoA dehydrogenase|nr:MAG: DNA alkylation response protein [Burkholderiaceae bacterium]
MADIYPNNQVPVLEDYNLYTSDPALRRAVERGGAGWRDDELVRQGAEYGSAEVLHVAEEANRFPPELRIYSALGDRIDEVRFHPAWHRMMAIARRNGIVNLPMFDTRASAWVGYGASRYLHSQVESGSNCPTTMTNASIPLLRRNPDLWAEIEPLLASTDYDARDIPLTEKRSINVGMGMTERQGGSDLRTNSTRAAPNGNGTWGDEFLINGHKWFFSAPMSDGHLVLARSEEDGQTCFFVPRWRPDGTKNGIHILRLKDKVGNRSNSSGEVEFHDAWGVRVGEPGRGIATTIEMASYTRLDCALSSAGFMRQAFVQALHYARGRYAFGRALAEQPVMAVLLADMALEVEAALLLAMDLAGRYGSDDGIDAAWKRVVTPAAKFWNCKRAVAFTGEAMEVLGGNGYIETLPMGRLFREAPVNSIWEGSGNVMCLDVLRAVARHPDGAHALLDHLGEIASQEPVLAARVRKLRDAIAQPAERLERQGRRFTQSLALTVQGCLMLRDASDEAAAAFIASRFDPDWGAVLGVDCGSDDAAALLREAWAD